jgi:hypothetical protein
MAECGALTYGFDYECNDGSGGVEQGSILIAQWDGVTASTVAAGVVTAITAGTFFRYQVRKYIAGDTGASVSDPKTGSIANTSTFVFSLFHMSGSKQVQLELLQSKPLVAIYTDNNGKNFILGLNNGAEVKNIDRQSGTDMGEMNGYTISIMHEDKTFPYEMDDTTLATLTISGELS